MSSKKFVARKKFMKNNTLASTLPESKVLSLTSRTTNKSYVDTSVKKLLVVADIIRGKNVEEVLTILHNLPQKAAKILYKYVKSAVANATNNAWLDLSILYVERIDLWRGTNIKRMRFASRSRIHSYKKYRSFVRVVLNSK